MLFFRMLVCTAVFVACASADDKDKKAKVDPAKKMQGVWTPAKAVLGGKPLPGPALTSLRLEIKDKSYKVTTADGEDQGSLELLLDKKPLGMDVIGEIGPNKGRRIPCIFTFEGDTLRICYDLSLKERPTEFKSKPQTKLFLVDYKRAE
jgi:uncharacterized protein (TIGR03067 family)